MSKVRLTTENQAEFEQAVAERLSRPVSIELYRQYNVWDFLGDIGFEFRGKEGVKAVEKFLMPKVLEKVPDAVFGITIYENAFAIISNLLWSNACAEATRKGYATPHSYRNVPVINIP